VGDDGLGPHTADKRRNTEQRPTGPGGSTETVMARSFAREIGDDPLQERKILNLSASLKPASASAFPLSIMARSGFNFSRASGVRLTKLLRPSVGSDRRSIRPSRSMRRTLTTIVGAGPAGLALARILQMHGCAVRVFEAYTSTRVRDQGGTLDLHEDTGQRALQMAGLTEAFRAHARFDDQESRLIDTATAEVLFEEIPAPGEDNRPEIDRKALRDLLLAALDPDTVTWGAKLQDVITEAYGRHRLRCSDWTSEPFDLVIGADGAWSKVRAALSPVTPVYTGITFVELWIDDVDRLRQSSSGTRIILEILVARPFWSALVGI
jgi:hypothetical protein